MSYNTSPDQIIGGNLVDPRDTNITNDPLNIIGTVAVSNQSTVITGGTITVDQPVEIIGTSYINTTNPLAVSLSNQGLGAGELKFDAWGIQKVSLPHSLFHGLWTFDIPSTMWFTYTNGTQVYGTAGTSFVNSVNSQAVIMNQTTSTCSRMESRECPRYQPNRGHLFSTALWCPNPTIGTREWGLQTNENGIFFRLKDGNLYAVRKSGGVQKEESLIDTSNLIGFDVSKGNIYDIQYQWRGVGNYNFYIGCPEDGVSKRVHQMKLLGTLTELSMENPALPIRFCSMGTSTDTSIHVGCADISTENGIDDFEIFRSAYSEAVAVTTNTPVIIIHSPLLFKGQTNTRSATLARISVNCSKKATFKVWGTRNSANITGATFKDLPGGSCLQSDSTDMDATAVRATSVTTTSLDFITSIPVEAASPRALDNPYKGVMDLRIVRGDYIIITCTSPTAVAECVVEWGEQI